MRKCTYCLSHKPLTEFFVNPDSGYRGRQCKACVSYLTNKTAEKRFVTGVSATSRTCNTCGETKTKERFYRNGAGRLWLKCQDCVEDKARKTRVLDPRPRMLASCRGRAKFRNKVVTLAISDIKIPSLCPTYYIPIKVNKGIRKDDSPSLDCIDSHGDYTPETSEVVSWRANRHKNDSTEEERILLVLHDLKRQDSADAKQAIVVLRNLLTPKTLAAVLRSDNLNNGPNNHAD